MASKNQQARRKLLLSGQANGSQLLQPGVVPMGIAHHPGGAFPVAGILPHGDGAVMHVVGGLHPLVWMVGQIAGHQRGLDAEDIVNLAQKLLDQCGRHLQARAEAAQKEAEAEAVEAPAEPAPAEEPKSESNIILE